MRGIGLTGVFVMTPGRAWYGYYSFSMLASSTAVTVAGACRASSIKEGLRLSMPKHYADDPSVSELPC